MVKVCKWSNGPEVSYLNITYTYVKISQKEISLKRSNRLLLTFFLRLHDLKTFYFDLSNI